MQDKDDSLLALFKFRNSRIAWGVLILALGVTAALWQFSIVLVEDRTKARFEAQSKQLKTAIEERLLNYEQVLAGSAGLFAVADLVGRNDWRTYVNKLDIERYYPGIQGLGYTERVPASNVEAHMEQMRAQGMPNYLVSPVGARTEYHPVVYLEPSVRNRRAFGYDAFEDPTHRRAMERARDTGQAAMTGKVVLVQENADEEKESGFLLYSPVYSNDVEVESSSLRQSALTGFVFSAFRMNNLMDGIVGLIAPFLDVRIFDGDVVSEEGLMYDSSLGSLDWDDNTFVSHEVIEHGGRNWLLVTRSTPAFDYLASDPRPNIVLGSGLIISILLFWLALVLIRSRIKAQTIGARFKAITEYTSNLTVVVDRKGALVYVSPSCEQLLGYSVESYENLRGEDYVHPDDLPSLQKNMKKAIQSPGNTLVVPNARIRHQDGHWLDMEGTYTSMLGVAGVDGVVANFRDLTELKQIQGDMHRLAFYDSLTGLANRELFKDRLEHAIKACMRRAEPAALLFLDLDGFKRINDTLGHDAGDHLLKQVSRWLTECVRKEDSVARLGGDEFTVLLAEVADTDGAARVAENILRALRRPIKLAEHEVRVSVSIGITMIPGDSDDATALMKFADLAMYRAKELGRDNYQFFSKAMNIEASRRMLMQEDLRNAIDAGDFALHYQPKLNLKTRELVGVEALVRWYHPSRGMIPASQFIELADETGLIIALGEWTLRQAFMQAHALRKAGYDKLTVAVNVSARQITDIRFVDYLKALVQECEIQPGMVELEVKASVLDREVESRIALFESIRVLGIELIIDNFGAGYCSLEYLNQMPSEVVKIDREFIRNIPYDQRSVEISSAVLAMARKLQFKVVAEGVETEEQLKFLENSGCEFAQGNFFSQPLEEGQLPGYISQAVDEAAERANKAE